ncbi:hypothetical protein [Capillimicrobium parvum]|uniref:Uncharacterized protein n=1 Tax=Capillimicrobium parvum TaxID=2884022 RepID=A0A9E6XW99_9ACTN|nr:hypothetical protein [Capillimicrobium parvum]UGS35636.1 hypothetical protein DSM104329_02031 [Capillimicrobium parvum]
MQKIGTPEVVADLDQVMIVRYPVDDATVEVELTGSLLATGDPDGTPSEIVRTKGAYGLLQYLRMYPDEPLPRRIIFMTTEPNTSPPFTWHAEF